MPRSRRWRSLHKVDSRSSLPNMYHSPEASTPRGAFNTGIQQMNMFTALQTSPQVGNDTLNSMEVLAAFRETYAKVITAKRKMNDDYKRIQPSYITRALLQNVADDLLSPDSRTGDIVTISSDNTEVDRALRELQEVFDFDKFLLDNIEDTLAYGDRLYAVDTGETADGTLGIKVYSVANQDQVVAFYDNPVFPKFYLSPDSAVDLVHIPARNIAHFCLFPDKFMVEIKSMFGHPLWDNHGVREFGRLGRSLFFNTFDQIKNLEVLEVLPIARKLSSIATSTLVGLPFPQDYNVPEAMEACEKYERVLNEADHLEEFQNQDQISVSDVLQAARFRVVPIFGEKGDLRRMDIPKIDPDTSSISEVDDTRRIIASTIGYPHEILFGTQPGVHKIDLLRSMARYVKKLMRIQMGISNGISQICAIWLGKKKLRFSPTDIAVSFANRLVNLEDLDKLEFSMQIMEALPSMTNSLGTLKDAGFPDKMGASLVETFANYLYSAGFDVPIDRPLKIVSTSDMMKEQTQEELERSNANRETELMAKELAKARQAHDAEQSKWQSSGGSGMSPFVGVNPVAPYLTGFGGSNGQEVISEKRRNGRNGKTNPRRH